MCYKLIFQSRSVQNVWFLIQWLTWIEKLFQKWDQKRYRFCCLYCWPQSQPSTLSPIHWILSAVFLRECVNFWEEVWKWPRTLKGSRQKTTVTQFTEPIRLKTPRLWTPIKILGAKSQMLNRWERPPKGSPLSLKDLQFCSENFINLTQFELGYILLYFLSLNKILIFQLICVKVFLTWKLELDKITVSDDLVHHSVEDNSHNFGLIWSLNEVLPQKTGY